MLLRFVPLSTGTVFSPVNQLFLYQSFRSHSPSFQVRFRYSLWLLFLDVCSMLIEGPNCARPPLVQRLLFAALKAVLCTAALLVLELRSRHAYLRSASSRKAE